MTKVFSQADSCKSMGLMQTAAIMDGQKVWLENGHGRSGILQIAPLQLLIARAFSQADSCKSSGFRQAAARRIRHQIATENLVDLNCGTRPAANTRLDWNQNPLDWNRAGRYWSKRDIVKNCSNPRPPADCCH